MISSDVQGLLAFLKKSPTGFHAVDAVREALDGFIPLKENEPWKLEAGKRYYVTRNRSSIIAFAMPDDGKISSFRLVASHSDSPTFKIKENSELSVNGKYIRLDTERYGGIIFNSWFDRPLSVAGRLVVKDETGIRTQLVNVDRDLLIIPNVAIHMNREINDGFKYHANVDVYPLFGSAASKETFMPVVAEAAGVRAEDIVGHDLFLYNRMPGTVWGKDGEFISAARLDDLECAYTSVRALLAAEAGDHVNVCCMFDNEEVGSTTKQGADSTFLSDVLQRIVLSAGGGRQEYLSALAGSFMLSADNAHAVHPNHPEYADPLNQVYMNEGIVIKFNANQKYTTDGISEAVFHQVCGHADVPVQHYTNRSDLAGGGTLGNISSSHVSVNTLDIGLAQLAMHSAWETAGTKDVSYMIEGMKAFYNAGIAFADDGDYRMRF